MGSSSMVGEVCRLALERAHGEYSEKNPMSLQKYLQACAVFPGGNTRSSLFYQPFPLTLVRGHGARLWDADGHVYTDYLGEHTAGLFGHSHPVIRDAVIRALDVGVDLGGHNDFEAELAALICARFPSIDLVRFTNSGTEANLMAIGAARAITKRPKVLVFEGAYHGSVLSFALGSGPINVPFEFVVAKYNHIESTIEALSKNSGEIAAVVVEPMMGPAGCIPAEKPFLEALRDVTYKRRTILIFDEVMTSRLSAGGLQEVYGITPDMTTLGKYIGGGMTFGAFGGKASIMGRFDLRRPGAFPHAGTFNNNVVSMAAGCAGMSLYAPDVADQLNARGDRLRHRLNLLLESESVKMQFTGIGSMLNVHMVSGPIRSPAEAARANVGLRELLYFDLMAQGIWIGRNGLIALSLPITDADCDQLIGAIGDYIERRRSLLSLNRQTAAGSKAL